MLADIAQAVGKRVEIKFVDANQRAEEKFVR
jgi:hypothetical protein